MPSYSVVGSAVGAIHRLWIRHPRRAALFAGCWPIGVLLASAALKIFWTIRTEDGRTVDGFAKSHWGLLFLIAVPLTTLLIGYYLRVLDNAVLTLDRVVKPIGNLGGEPFSQFLATRVRLQWATWVYPLSLLGSLLLTLAADGRDIIAPLQSKTLPASGEIDWSTVGYSVRDAADPLWYLGFNVAAWTMQVFLGYCGLLVLALTGSILATVFRYGLGGKKTVDLFVVPGSATEPPEYEPVWDYTSKRCGLGAMDWVFLFFVGQNLLILVISAISILVNIHMKAGADLGSSILALATIVVLPLASFWVFTPYFANFPDELPVDLRDKPACRKPSPWPFGSARLAWVLLSVTALFWLFLFQQVLWSVFSKSPSAGNP